MTEKMSQNVAERLRRSWGRKRQGRSLLNAAGPGCCFIRQGLTGESSSLSATRIIAPTPTSRPTSPMIQLELPSSSFAPAVAEAAREALDAADAATGAATTDRAAKGSAVFSNMHISFSVAGPFPTDPSTNDHRASTRVP